MPTTRSSARKQQNPQLHKAKQPIAEPQTIKTTPTEPMKPTMTKKKHYTHLNSDKDCLQNPQSFWQLAFYRLQLYNGLYMLDRSEQVFLYSLAAIVVLLLSWYGYAFVHGLLDGWRMTGSSMQ